MRYYDPIVADQVISTLYKQPQLLEQDDKFHLIKDDFNMPIQRLLFTSIYNLYSEGASLITPELIETYLSSRPVYKSLYDDKNGKVILESYTASKTDISSFEYYYNRLKKFTLLRMFDNYGVDVSWLYNPDAFDGAVIQQQNEFLDSLSVSELADKVDKRIEQVKLEYLGAEGSESVQAGEGIEELIERMKQAPEVGIPLYGDLINTITMGARLKKFYLISAPSGQGKTRQLLQHAAHFSCGSFYKDGEWVDGGAKEPSLFITTELEIEEVQTMALSYLSEVQENHILNGRYLEGEEQRVFKAAKILQSAPLRIEHLPDFSIRDVEATIRRNVYEHGTKYVCFDYIHTSLKILEEVSQRTKGVSLREDNVLLMLAIKLKDLCNELGIFLLSATQVNGSWEERETSNQNVLRGAKSLADKVDIGVICLPTTDRDKEALQEFVELNNFPMPNMVHHIYKNRRGRFKSVKLWCVSDLGTCRVNPVFLTDDNYSPIHIENIKIKVKPQAERLNFGE